MRSTVPYGLWRSTLAGATTVIDLAVSHLLFLADAVWDLPTLLADKSSPGVRVRIVTPENPAGPVTGLGDVFPSLLSVPGLRLFTHPGLRADVMPEADGRVFIGAKGATPRRNHFNRLWHKACEAAGIKGLHFHDLRHTGNTLAASTGASTRELMARMGHSTARAALIYQHASADRDRLIAEALSSLVDRGRRPKGHAGGTAG